MIMWFFVECHDWIWGFAPTRFSDTYFLPMGVLYRTDCSNALSPCWKCGFIHIIVTVTWRCGDIAMTSENCEYFHCINLNIFFIYIYLFSTWLLECLYVFYTSTCYRTVVFIHDQMFFCLFVFWMLAFGHFFILNSPFVFLAYCLLKWWMVLVREMGTRFNFY